MKRPAGKPHAHWLAMVWAAGILCTIVTGAVGEPGKSEKFPDYVGSETCVSCHRAAGDAWRTSHHAQAWNEPTGRWVRGDFDNRTFEHKGVLSRFTRDGGNYFVTTDGADGKSRRFKVAGTVGVEPLQQYLVETEPGRLQALDLVWDTQQKRWYHLYPDQDLPHTNGLHWTGPYKNWNARCAECHATGYEKRYSQLKRRYATRQAEKSVGCEACHGPGSAHVTRARDSKSYDPAAWSGVNAAGLTIGFGRKSPETEIQQCAGCHSRREAFDTSSPVPGTPFHDSYRLALLRDGLYHAGGQIRDEVYVYGSFLQSKMYVRGVRCTNCHDPHSGALKAKGNAVCTQCHNPVGNAAFPTLRRSEYDSPAHHFHKPGSDAAQCKSCHMIERVYMGIDGRRDHSFRVPRPDLSEASGTPNACTDCHKDKSPSWAAAKVTTLFPDTLNRPPNHTVLFSDAREGRSDPDIARSLLETALSSGQSGIVRATALDLLGRYATQGTADGATGLLRDPDPVLRAAAIPLQRTAPPAVRVKRLGPLLRDQRRSVRIAAVRALLDILAEEGSPMLARFGRQAIEEYQHSLTSKADFPAIQMAMAGTAMVFKKFRAAEQAFSEAVRLDPQRVDAWMMIARLRAAQGDTAGATKALRDAVAANPDDARLSNFLKDFRRSDGAN